MTESLSGQASIPRAEALLRLEPSVRFAEILKDIFTLPGQVEDVDEFDPNAPRVREVEHHAPWMFAFLTHEAQLDSNVAAEFVVGLKYSSEESFMEFLEEHFRIDTPFENY